MTGPETRNVARPEQQNNIVKITVISNNNDNIPVSVHDVLGEAEHLHVEGLLQPAVEAGVAHLCRYVDIFV